MEAVMSPAPLAGEHHDWAQRLESSLEQRQWSSALNPIASKLAANLPLTLEDGLVLYHHPDVNEVGALANVVRQSRFGSKAFFNSNVHINQTNICVLACRFCAFRRGPKAKDAYAMSVEDYLADLATYAHAVDEVHSVGGLHPEWGVEHYETLFQRVAAEHPHISIKALTAVEIKHLGQRSSISTKEVLRRLKDAGLTSLPGGGAEILDDDVRAVICNGKESSEEYLRIHREAHEVGLPSNCTMLFGTIETLEQRLQHMISLRELNEQTHGFQCFVPYPFLPDDTRLPEAQLASGSEVLRTIAVSRLMLNNIPHIKAYRMNIGDHLAELALQFGADDIDGTVQKESIMHLAGSTAPLDHDRAKLARLIHDAGCEPVQRNTIYTEFKAYTPPPVQPRRRLQMASD
ncbi:MAG: CofH family radical SAM protein [Candidatus Thermoplasmatota archaeon]|nr:CofH family radical SAM protein [Candidatus Thermoplasmatota archaeon]MEE2974017.1 CofH family radical SAM protein [Candidatus Thermoplasmatota archaeon]